MQDNLVLFIDVEACLVLFINVHDSLVLFIDVQDSQVLFDNVQDSLVLFSAFRILPSVPKVYTEWFQTVPSVIIGYLR